MRQLPDDCIQRGCTNGEWGETHKPGCPEWEEINRRAFLAGHVERPPETSGYHYDVVNWPPGTKRGSK